MLTEVWGPVFTKFDVTLDVEKLHRTSEGVTIALGSYRALTAPMAAGSRRGSLT